MDPKDTEKSNIRVSITPEDEAEIAYLYGVSDGYRRAIRELMFGLCAALVLSFVLSRWE